MQTNHTDTLLHTLHTGQHSLVVAKDGAVHTFDGPGVSDLLRLLRERPTLLAGAAVADKIIGKAAAALMICGGVSAVSTDVISTPALALFRQHGIEPSYAQEVHHIINRAHDGWCPLERTCYDLQQPEAIRQAILAFIQTRR